MRIGVRKGSSDSELNLYWYDPDREGVGGFLLTVPDDNDYHSIISSSQPEQLAFAGYLASELIIELYHIRFAINNLLNNSMLRDSLIPKDSEDNPLEDITEDMDYSLMMKKLGDARKRVSGEIISKIGSVLYE